MTDNFADNSTPMDPDEVESVPDHSVSDPPQPSVSSRGRMRRPTQLLNIADHRKPYYTASKAAVYEDDLLTQRHDKHLGLQDRMRHPIAFHAEMIGDVMYYHQSMKQDYAEEFCKAVEKEVSGHIENGHWELVHKSEIPNGQETIPSVWSM